MAKLKSEFLQHYNDIHRPSLRTRIIANLPEIYRLFSPIPRIFNLFASGRITSLVIKNLSGFAAARSIPLLSHTTFRRWLRKNLGKLNPASPVGELCLFVDEFTNHNDAHAGICAVRLLTGLGYRVITVRHSPSARTYISKGFLRKARRLIINNIKVFEPLISPEKPLVGIEPSAILGFRDEYPDLAGEEYRQKAMKIAAGTMLFEEFLIREYREGRISRDMFRDDVCEVLVHVHCQEKAVATSAPVIEALGIPAGFRVREIPSGCCGMAGAFGYEKEHYDLSQKIGELILFPEVRNASDKTVIIAPGTSCRHHIKDGTGRVALHPAEVLYAMLKKGNGQ